MLAPLLVAWLGAASIAAPVDLLVAGDFQVRGGYSHTPFLSSPDAQPLLNLYSTAGQYELDLIVAPALTFTAKGRDIKFSLAYSPRLLLDIINIAGDPPIIYHTASTELTLGRAAHTLFTLGATTSIGGIDYGQAGQVLQEFSGSLKPGASANTLQLFTLRGYARLELPFAHGWKWTSDNSVSQMDTPSTGSSGTLSSNPANASGANTQGGLNAVASLQRMQQLFTINDVSYKINDAHKVKATATFSTVTFPATFTYLAFTGGAGYEGQVSKLDKIKASLGLLKVWVNNFPGVWVDPRKDPLLNFSSYMPVFDFSVEHKFADINLPRLTGTLGFGEVPYYDIIYGLMEHRGSLTGLLTYDFTRAFQMQLSVRDYTEIYWDVFGSHKIVPLQPGYDKNLLQGSLSAKYTQSKFLSFVASITVVDRSLQDAATLPYTSLQDFYALVGLSGNYDVD